MDNIQDNELRSRSNHIHNLLRSRWADGTNKKYQAAWEKWRNWCSSYPESVLRPADPFYIALYLNDIVMGGGKIGAIDAAVSGIRWGHIMEGYENPLDCIFLRTLIEGAKRAIGKGGESNQKEPFTTEMAKQVVNLYAVPTNLFRHRIIIICLLRFAGFLRISELLQIQVNELVFTDKDMQIIIPKAKCDQLREGHIVHISRTGSEYCPVYWVEKYLHETGLMGNGEAFLICRLAKTKKGHKAIGKYNLSDTTVRDIFKEHVAPICEQAELGSYGLHSLRSGGASTAINNGIGERLVGKHGRWKSGYSRDRYLKDSRTKRLSVTQALGL